MKRNSSLIALFLVAAVLVPALIAEDLAKKVEDLRRETIRYGTDAEILKLVAELEGEKTEYLDDELAAVLESTKNGKIASTIFGFFARRKAPIVEERAIRTVRERDVETNEAVDAAIEYLGLIGSKDAPPVLREILESEEARFMLGAVRALGRSGGASADENATFLLAYNEEHELNDSVKQAIVEAFGELKSKNATTFLSNLVSNGDEKTVRRMAALDSLGMIGDPAALDTVIGALTATDPNVRASAIAALGPFSGEKVDAAILEAFRDSYYKARIAAAKAAGERKLGDATQYLRYRAEQDDVPAVREASISALGAIGSSESLKAVRTVFDEKKYPDRIRIAAASTLLKADESANARDIVVALDEAKNGKRTALYNGLLRVLSAAKSDALEDFARRLLASEDITEKLYAIELIRGNGYRSLEGELKKLAEDKNPTISRKAQDALAKLGAP